MCTAAVKTSNVDSSQITIVDHQRATAATQATSKAFFGDLWCTHRGIARLSWLRQLTMTWQLNMMAVAGHNMLVKA